MVDHDAVEWVDDGGNRAIVRPDIDVSKDFPGRGWRRVDREAVVEWAMVIEWLSRHGGPNR